MMKTIESKVALDSPDKSRIRGIFAGGLAAVQEAVGDRLSRDKISENIEDTEFVTLLGVTARATFSELTSLLDRKKTPWAVHATALEMLSTIGHNVYANDEFRGGLKDIVLDDEGNEYYFDLEMARDVADFLVAVSVIFPGKESEGLHNIAATIWNGIIFHSRNVPSQRSFFNLERSRFLYQIGRKADIYWTGAVADLQEFFDTHTQQEGDQLIVENKDKVASVIARAHELGVSLGCKELEELARIMLEKIADRGKANANLADQEHSQASKEQFRRKVMKVVAPLSSLAGNRQKLVADLRDFGTNQRDRLGVARV